MNDERKLTEDDVKSRKAAKGRLRKAAEQGDDLSAMVLGLEAAACPLLDGLSMDYGDDDFRDCDVEAF